ncbi:MAG TPA: zf-HC2 domain-containing protein [Gemmatimonadaceae bacterium]|nr:zf-HC2 domain-containing protein [Gemmatimonadaceae bacterium]
MMPSVHSRRSSVRSACRGVRGVLDAFTDGELPRRDADAVAAHLARCVRCVRLAAHLGAYHARMRRTRTARASAALRGRVRAALEAEARRLG